jgi:hypothetical protein
MWKTYQNFKLESNDTYRLPIAIQHSLSNWPLVDFRKEEVRKRDYFFHPQLNTNPMMERDFGAGNRNNILIEGVFCGQVICPE